MPFKPAQHLRKTPQFLPSGSSHCYFYVFVCIFAYSARKIKRIDLNPLILNVKIDPAGPTTQKIASRLNLKIHGSGELCGTMFFYKKQDLNEGLVQDSENQG